jgi:hypothetical protein
MEAYQEHRQQIVQASGSITIDNGIGFGAEAKRLEDLSWSLSSAVSQHIKSGEAVHSGDVRKRILKLLRNVGPKLGDDPDVEAMAKEIAHKRGVNDLKRKIVDRFEGNERHKNVAIYAGENPYVHINRLRSEAFSAELADGIKALNENIQLPSENDKTVANLVVASNNIETNNTELTMALTKALEYDAPIAAKDIAKERSALLGELTKDKSFDKERADSALRRLYKAFSHTEVAALSVYRGLLCSSQQCAKWIVETQQSHAVARHQPPSHQADKSQPQSLNALRVCVSLACAAPSHFRHLA